MEEGKLIYHYNWFDTERYKVESAAPLAPGKAEIRMDFVNEGEKPGGPASVDLFVNDKKVGSGKLPKQVAYRFSVESMDVGMDTDVARQQDLRRETALRIQRKDRKREAGPEVATLVTTMSRRELRRAQNLKSPAGIASQFRLFL